MNRRTNVSPERWAMAADLYELGFTSGQQLARDLGVSPQTVSREMKRRRAVKGSRVHQTIADLDAFFDRKARREAYARMLAETTVAQRRAAGMAAINKMLAALVRADELGDLTLADADVASVGAAFGVRSSRRR